MTKTVSALSAALLALCASGCYNSPHISNRLPDGKHSNVHSGPAVGPGTVAGGSTAGPQPAAPGEHGDAQAHGTAAEAHPPTTQAPSKAYATEAGKPAPSAVHSPAVQGSGGHEAGREGSAGHGVGSGQQAPAKH
ncbi:MAG TPA: hypothetical protein VEQ63_01390 [Bryobacteraceae bacterium]|nr:hypothetical protein [Bryobacteraceae bacterium]